MEEKEEKPVSVETGTDKKPSGFNFKILFIGIPVFIIQLVAVYFITANFLISKEQSSSYNDKAKTEEQQSPKGNDSKSKSEEGKPAEFGKFIYVVDDLIVNPANTDGKRLLLTSLGFDVASQENHEELKTKDVLLKDAVISVISSKNLSQLANMAYRDTLKMEITNRLRTSMPKVKINTIYFSKYILQ